MIHEKFQNKNFGIPEKGQKNSKFRNCNIGSELQPLD